MVDHQSPYDYEVVVGVARTDDAAARPVTLEDAFADAWDRVTDKRRPYRVLEIEVAGTNPINEYRVVLTPR